MRTLAWPVLLLLLLGGLSTAAPTPQGVSLNLRPDSLPGGRRGPDQVRFEIDAAPVAGLYPGAAKPMRLLLVNPTGHDLRVESLAGTVRATSRHGCAPEPYNLVVHPVAGPPALPVVVPAHQRRSAGSVTVSMPGTVVDACQRATFEIRFVGSGTKVRR